MRLAFIIPALCACLMLGRVVALDSMADSSLGSPLDAALAARQDDLVIMDEPVDNTTVPDVDDGDAPPEVTPETPEDPEKKDDGPSDTDDANGPDLEGPPQEGREFSSLTSLYERRVCRYGWKSCRNQRKKCCPIGGDCCRGRKCCPKGHWCYGQAPCCKRIHYGCDRKGCCPYGWQCCKGGSCCKPGYYCVVIKGRRGCCPWGKRCRSRY